MKNILLPTDYADHSPQLLNYALAVAKKMDAKLVTMHVYGLPEDEYPTPKEKIELAEYMLDVLKDFINKNKEDQYNGVELEYIVGVGLPEKEIVDVALDENIDLIMMGMTGKGKAGDNIFGRTSLAVIGKSDCPVLAIPAAYNYQALENIAYLTDFHFRDIGAMNRLRQWATLLPAKVHCLHVSYPYEFSLDAEVNMGMLKDCYKGDQFADFKVLEGDFIPRTNQYIEEQNIGIIAMLSRKRSFLRRIIEGSNARKMAKRIRVPLLIFKENAYKPVSYPIDFTGFSIA